MKELRGLASSLDDSGFQGQLGPFVLVQKPPTPVLAAVAMRMGAGRTVAMAHRRRLVEELVAMLHGFDDLLVATLPPLGGVEELQVGRLPDCELLIEEPSVSKRHAVLRWDAASARCTVQDVGSTNGTFVNANQIGGEVVLQDGDTLSFGDAQFIYLLAETLRGQLLATRR